MDGTDDVNTAVAFSFIYRSRVLIAGSSEVNVGNITITAATDATISAVIIAGKGQTLMAVYRVPRNKALLLTGINGGLGRNAPSNSRCNLELSFRLNATTSPYINVKDTLPLFFSSGLQEIIYDSPVVVDALTDISMVAQDCTDNNTEVTAKFWGELINV